MMRTKVQRRWLVFLSLLAALVSATVFRTIEDLLGLHHLSMNTANADPMSDVFALTADLRP
jgi:hypothetical protein